MAEESCTSACSLPGGCALWGILNVTPDSFSDGGRYLNSAQALVQARALISAGAQVIDIGGASSRPQGSTYGQGATEIPVAVEVERVVPVVAALAAETSLPISIDTTQAEVAQAALAAGASIVNDVSCARYPALLRVTADAGAEYVLMHNRGDGAVAGDHIHYNDVVSDVCAELSVGIERVRQAGVAPERIWVDPGLGFAKTPSQSLELLASTDRLRALGYRVLVGPSRKTFLAVLGGLPGAPLPAPEHRQPATDAAVVIAAWLGADAVRVHDVVACGQALRLALAARGVHEALR